MISDSLSVFDLHCDTALEMYRAQLGFDQNPFHISGNKIRTYRHYGQVTAIFCPHHLLDEEGWNQFFCVLNHFKTHLDGKAELLTLGKNAEETWKKAKSAFYLSIEDARILAGKIERISVLYDAGVRILTPLWKESTCIGGSYDTQEGLTKFGMQVIRECLRIGIVPDISHASEQSAEEICDLSEEAGKPCIASHSNSYTVHNHARNLRDRHFGRILHMDGRVGLNLCPDHLGSHNFEKLLEHAEHYLEFGGENHLCLGCDFDGTDLPNGISGIQDLEKIAELFAKHNYSESLIQNIFWKNALTFVQNYLI